jgi:hypothetical protein
MVKHLPDEGRLLQRCEGCALNQYDHNSRQRQEWSVGHRLPASDDTNEEETQDDDARGDDAERQRLIGPRESQASAD